MVISILYRFYLPLPLMMMLKLEVVFFFKSMQKLPRRQLMEAGCTQINITVEPCSNGTASNEIPPVLDVNL